VITRPSLAGVAGVLGAIAVAGVFVAALSWVARSTSATFDETTYLQLSDDMGRSGAINRLTELGVAPVPIVAWMSRPGADAGALPDANAAYRARVDSARQRAVWWFGVPLILLVFGWAAVTRGWLAGVLAAGTVALSPTVVACASIAATDVCLAAAFVAALAAAAWYVTGRSPIRAAVLAVALGLALASKYTAAFLFPTVALLMWRWRGPDGHARPIHQRRPGLDALALCGGVVVAWAFTGFAMSPLISPEGLARGYYSAVGRSPFTETVFDGLASIRVPTPVRGIVVAFNHDRAGHDAFLFGERSRTGWWYYFPAALACKSTPLELAAILLFGWWAWRRRGPDATHDALRLAVGVFGAAALLSHLNLGVRHVLPVLVICLLGATMAVAEWCSRRPRAAAWAAVVAIAVQAVSMASVAPRALGYVSPFAGGPANGYRLLADSSLDWGQDLPALRNWLATQKTDTVALAYFGTAPPGAYGVRAVNWRDPSVGTAQGPRWLAVSITHLDGLYLCGDPFSALRGIAPSARASYSIMIYALDRPDVRAALTAARQRECLAGS